MNILNLNEYVILKIFEYCSDADLENLYDVCKMFQNIIENRIYYLRSLNLLLSGHKGNPINCKRTSSALTYRDRIRISDNLVSGRYTERIYFNHNKFYASRIFIDKTHFYMTHTGMLRIHKRLLSNTSNEAATSRYYYLNNDEMIERRIFKEIGSPMKSDISDFKKKSNEIFAGRTCGKCFIYDLKNDNEIYEQKLHPTSEYLMAVDFYRNVYVTSTDKTCKLWLKSIELGLVEMELMKEFNENFKCLNMLPSGEKLIGGKYMDLNRRALREIDIESGITKILNSNTLSIYDVKHHDENIVFTANFDTTFRLFDRRTNRDEQIWIDPYDSSVYCLEHDGLYAVLCGMKYCCRVNLYDIRVPKKFIQMYFPILRKTTQGSPVYSLTCDARYLFLTTDHNLRVWDYKASWAESRDYTNIFDS